MYGALMTRARPWPAELTRVTGQQVRRYREKRRMTADQLAAKVTELGLRYTRAQVTNLEAERRDSVTVGEVFILASALGVPALLLVFPVGRVNAVEVLPGQEMTPWTALRWALTGRPQVLGTEVSEEDAELIDSFRYESDLIERWAHARAEARSLQDRGGDPTEIEQLEQRQWNAIDALRHHRRLLRQSGLTPLGFPAGLSYLDEEASS
jgi:transcriptional regulator with XRE-family HTH domain